MQKSSLAGLLLFTTVLQLGVAPQAESLGLMTPHAYHAVPRYVSVKRVPLRSRVAPSRPLPSVNYLSSKRNSNKAAVSKKSKHETAKKPVAKAAPKPLQPQRFADSMSSETLAPGVVHRFIRGPLSINLLDIDMVKAPVKVQPNLAGESFDRLKDVAEHARETKAIAAVNANYFKTNGTPLGTLIIDGEWISGPLFNRVSMGITNSGNVLIDCVNLKGNLTTNNPALPAMFVNNINQPKRHGSHLIAYTRRWGSSVRLPYAGCLVAVNAQGEVQDKSTTVMGIPYGGYVLCDSKDSPISKLERGDQAQLSWSTAPSQWENVTEAVSGGPMLIKDNRLFLDLKDENFRKSWTGAQIKARTAAGVTANKHLILATIEGPHTLWDVAKFLHKMGCVDAMNLDGGGSTTMVVNGNTVTRNAHAHQRHVASSLVIVDSRRAQERTIGSAFHNGRLQTSASITPYDGELVSEPELTASAPENVAPASSIPVESIPALSQPAGYTSPSPIQVKKRKHWFGF